MPQNTTILKKYPTIGVCGLDCGLCPRYYTDGPSRCPGCGGPDFFHKHPSCSYITCCVKRKGLEVCAECGDFPCVKFRSKEVYNNLNESPSYPPYRKVMSNLNFIKEQGIERFMAIQKRRIEFLEYMIKEFDDGRSRCLFCRASALLELNELEKSLDEATLESGAKNLSRNDIKGKAKILKKILYEAASKRGIELIKVK